MQLTHSNYNEAFQKQDQILIKSRCASKVATRSFFLESLFLTCANASHLS
jgi:hypothetical protein